MKRCALVIFAVFGLCPMAQAEIIVAPSLEWLADHCIDSGVYVVTNVAEEEGKSSVELSLTLKNGLRGQPTKQMQQGYYKVRLSDPKRPLVQKGDEFLICFQHYTTGEKRVVQTINLDNPQTAGYSVIAASCNLSVLKTKNDILKVFEERLKSHPKADPVEISDYSRDNRVALAKPTELFSAVYAGSSCYLRVPDDLVEKVRTESRRQETKANNALHSDAVKAEPNKPSVGHATEEERRMTVEALMPLVREYAFREKPKLNPKTQFKIEEYEVKGLWQALKMQLFLARYMSMSPDGGQFNEQLLICRDGKVTPFAGTLGGHGLMSAVLMNDGLYYTYSFGSGIHRSHIGRLSIDGGDIRIIESGGYADTDLFVKTVDGRVQVEAGDFGSFNSWKATRQMGWLKVKASSLALVNATGDELPPQFGKTDAVTDMLPFIGKPENQAPPEAKAFLQELKTSKVPTPDAARTAVFYALTEDEKNFIRTDARGVSPRAIRLHRLAADLNGQVKAGEIVWTVEWWHKDPEEIRLFIVVARTGEIVAGGR